MKKQTVFLLLAALVLLLVVVGVFNHEQGVKNQPVPDVADTETFLYRDYSPIEGADAAKVTIVEFMDPACGPCAAFFPFVKQQLAKYDGKVKLIVRHLPFHHNSAQVITALEAAKEQDKYWLALDITLQHQKDWMIEHSADVEKLYPFYAAAGIDIEQLQRDMKNPEIAKRISQESQDAESLGVRLTPSFYVNGKPLVEFGPGQLAELIAGEVAVQYPAP